MPQHLSLLLLSGFLILVALYFEVVSWRGRLSGAAAPQLSRPASGGQSPLWTAQLLGE